MNPGSIEHLLNRMSSDAEDQILGGGQYVRWRHQKIGERRIESDNAMGMDPEGMIYEADDRHRMATKQKLVFFAQFIPIRGDLIITLRGAPQTKFAARQAPELAYFKVKEIQDVRRTNDGELIHCKFKTKPDHSGQWDGS